jgi:hypothetical protein
MRAASAFNTNQAGRKCPAERFQTMATIHDEVNEKIELAKIYAEDGAFISAARVLREAAAIYQRRAEEINAAMTKELGNL